jgi:uncharacterized protein (DUF4415 family)
MKPRSTSKPPATAKRVKAANANSVHEPDCPYDAQNEKAVTAFWQGASVRLPGQRGPQKQPTKTAVTIRYSPEVLHFFKQTGNGWQTRMNDILLAHVLKSK